MSGSDDIVSLAAPDVGVFWQLMGARPVAVPVVTARDEAGPAGLLALSTSHVAAAPPTMSVAVGAKTSALSTIRQAGSFAINYLGEDDAELADIFGGRKDLTGAERFSAAEWTTLASDAPVLAGAVLALDCAVLEVFEHGGTFLILGGVRAYRLNAGIRPLTLFMGQYRSV